MLKIDCLPSLTDNYIYLLHDTYSAETAVVDPSKTGPVLNILKKRNWRLDYIFNTHHHQDHVGGNMQLKQTTGCKIVGAAADSTRIPGIDIALNDGECIQLGNQTLQVITTPGHTSGHIVYYCADSRALFCGDTLFSLGCGRLFEGTAEQMWHSLQKLKALPGATRIYCAHEYTQANGRFALSLEADNKDLQHRLADVEILRANNQPTLPSTIAMELATNPFLREDSVSLREAISARPDDSPIAVFAKIRKLKDQF